MRNTFAQKERAEARLFRDMDLGSTGDELFDEHIASEWKKLRVKEHDFGDVYDAAELDADQKKIERARSSFEDKEAETARGLHYAVMEGISQYDWLGPDAHVVPTSEYDDYINGTDFIVCFEQENGESVKIAVDATTSDSRPVLKKKIERVRDKLRLNGWLGEVKYFEYVEGSFEQEPRGALALPRVILGTETADTKALISFFSRTLEQKGERGKMMRQELAQDNIQHQLVSEMIAQLGMQLDAALNRYEDMNPEDCPESVNRLLNWVYDREELPDKSIIPEAFITRLEQELPYLREDAHAPRESNLRSAVKIGEALCVVAKLQKEKSAGESSSARNKTEGILRNPDQLFAA